VAFIYLVFFGSTFSKGGFALFIFGSTFSKGEFALFIFGSTFSKGGFKGGFILIYQ